MKKILIISVFLIFIYACSDNKRIKEDTFTDFYTDLVIAQDTTQGGYDELKSIREELFNKYKITSEQYEETIDYYNSDPRRWKNFFDKVLAKIEKMQKEHSGEGK